MNAAKGPVAIVHLALSASLLLLACLAGCGSDTSVRAAADTSTADGLAGASVAQPFRFFSPTGFWNKRLADAAPLDPISARAIPRFEAEIEREKRLGTPPTINTRRWSVPIYKVPADQPKVRVEHAGAGTSPSLQRAWSAVPLPPGAHPAAGSDRHLVVWQPSSDKLWEFWHLRHDSAGWHARWGGAMEHVSTNPGVYGPEAWPGATSHWGATASSLSLAGGLITLEDFAAGKIEHALAIGIPDVRADEYSAPARRTDGTSGDPLALPEGAHLRLDPELNLASLGLPPTALMIARAAQHYGIFVRSLGSHVVFFGQDPVPTGTGPYMGANGFFEDTEPSQLLEKFPWGHLQLLKMTLHRES
jgi:hypothetical protein